MVTQRDITVVPEVVEEPAAVVEQVILLLYHLLKAIMAVRQLLLPPVCLMAAVAAVPGKLEILTAPDTVEMEQRLLFLALL